MRQENVRERDEKAKEKERKKLFEMKFSKCERQAEATNKMRSKRKRKYALHSDGEEKSGVLEGPRYLVQIPENANLFQRFYAVHRKTSGKKKCALNK